MLMKKYRIERKQKSRPKAQKKTTIPLLFFSCDRRPAQWPAQSVKNQSIPDITPRKRG
jgi:hypothetical protein